MGANQSPDRHRPTGRHQSLVAADRSPPSRGLATCQSSSLINHQSGSHPVPNVVQAPLLHAPVISAHHYCALDSPLRSVAHQSRQPATDSRTPRLQPQPTDRKHQAGKHPGE
ncbi:hypothetical protein V6N13_042880 [Hibiscus sabdariffa]